MTNAYRDENDVPTLIASSSVDGKTPVRVYADPTTHRLLIDNANSGAITSINGDTTQAQTLTVGTSGTDFAIVDNGTGDHKFNLPTASATNRGALSPTDWSTFNGKQAAGNYITALTGDVTAVGPGSAAATLATVNNNVGTFGSATQSVAVTVNGKGLVTAASQTTITPAVGSITGLGSGIATFLATPSSANLAAALTDETGTGAAVFAGSPAFTGIPTAPQILMADNNVTATSNAATITRANRNNVVTNNSAATLTITLSTTGATAGDMLLIQVLDFSAVAQTITWVNTENSTVTVPTTSNGSTTLPLTIGFKWNPQTSKWRCLASA